MNLKCRCGALCLWTEHNSHWLGLICSKQGAEKPPIARRKPILEPAIDISTNPRRQWVADMHRSLHEAEGTTGAQPTNPTGPTTPTTPPTAG